MVVQHNLPGVNAERIYNSNSSDMKRSLEKLSSGYKINRSADDAAGLAVSEKMRSQIFGMRQSIRNCEDGVSLIQTFEGALDETVTIIKRMKTLAVQSANGNYDDGIDRNAIHIEYKQLCDEVSHLADTDFNGIVMLNGRQMSDNYTFITNDGKWNFPVDKWAPDTQPLLYDFRTPEGDSYLTMNRRVLPCARQLFKSDVELMQAFQKLNGANIKIEFEGASPVFKLTGLSPDDTDKFIIESEGNLCTISTYTHDNGKVEMVQLKTSDLEHHASTSAMGQWVSNRVASCTLPDPLQSTPGNEKFNVDDYILSNINTGAGNADKRKAYVEWIKATSATATLIPDKVYNDDTDVLKFKWGPDGKEYTLTVGSDGIPTQTVDLPLYSDTSKGPQVILKNFKFTRDDEDMKPYDNYTTYNYSWTSWSSGISRTIGNRSYYGGSISRDTDAMRKLWYEKGDTTITLTYTRGSVLGTGTWSDQFGNGGYTVNKEYYNPKYYSESYTRQNLTHCFASDGDLPNGFTVSFSLTCPVTRDENPYDLVYSQNTPHSDYYSSKNYNDLKLEELDPNYPDRGGVDYAIAKHGAVYTYDGHQQNEGDPGVWRDEEGNEVKLEDVGIHLPSSLSSSSVLPLHDGMSIKVNNPTMADNMNLEARMHVFEDLTNDLPVSINNCYRQASDNLTYVDSLVLQANSRGKDAVNFTFAYSGRGLGDLEPDLNCSAKGLGLDQFTLKTQKGANLTIDGLDHALSKVLMIRATFGAAQNRLDHKVNDLNTSIEELTSAESVIRDTNIAEEMVNFTKRQIVSQASQSMLAQAESLPQQALSLISE